MYAPYAWPLVAPAFWQTYQAVLGAPPNSTASTVAIRSLHEKLHDISRRAQQFQSFTRSEIQRPQHQQRGISGLTRSRLGERAAAPPPAAPPYDFSSATAAIACGDGADDLVNSSTASVFQEVVTAAGVSQKFGEVWFVILYCNQYVSESLSLQSL